MMGGLKTNSRSSDNLINWDCDTSLKESLKTIHSLGSSTRTWDEFLEILVKFGIELLVDVRSFPASKYEHFKRENLEDTLKKAGFQYAYLGRELGGYRKGGYEAYTRTPSFLKGVDLLG